MGCGCNKKVEELKKTKMETFMNHCYNNRWIFGIFILVLIIIVLFIIFIQNNKQYIVLPKGSIVGSPVEYNVDLNLEQYKACNNLFKKSN